MLVLEAGIVGWEASGRNGGGATHVYSPLGLEEQRLWPQMDTLLGYPTEHMPHRIKVALSDDQLTLYRTNAEIAAQQGFRTEPLDGSRSGSSCRSSETTRSAASISTSAGTRTPSAPSRPTRGRSRISEAGSASTRPSRGSAAPGAGSPPSRPRPARSSADTVVLAAGPQTDRLAARLGVSVPLAPARVEMICTEPLPLMKVGGVDGNGLYGRQTRRGNLVYGGGPHEWLDAAGLAATASGRPTTPLLRSLGRRLAELFPGAAHMRVIRSWAGIVENTPDGLPILDRLRDPSNVVLATMSSVGFGLSPASGKAISELVLHGQCRFADLTALRLNRFAETPPDWRTRLGWLPTTALG